MKVLWKVVIFCYGLQHRNKMTAAATLCITIESKLATIN